MTESSPTEFKRDLSGLKGLRGLPPPPPPAAPQARPPATEDPPPADAPAEGGASARTSTDETPKTRSTSKSTGKRRAAQPSEPQGIPTRGDKALFTITLTSSLRKVFKETADAEGVPYGEWFLDAFDNQYENLEQLFAPPPARRSPLPPKRPTSRRRTEEGSPPIQLYMDIAAAIVVEEAREARQGISRAAFCGRIIEAELKGRGIAVDRE